MMKVGTAAAGVSTAEALRPYVLAVAGPSACPFAGAHAVAGVEGGCIACVISLTVGLPYEISAIAVRSDLFVSVCHKIVQGRLQRA